MRASLEPSTPAIDSADLKRWLLLEDSVLSQQAGQVLGAQGLKALAANMADEGELFGAAKIKWLFTNVETGDKVASGALLKDALGLLEESGRLSALDAQQLEWVRAARATLRARTMSLAH